MLAIPMDKRLHVRMVFGACADHAEQFLAMLAVSAPLAAAMKSATTALLEKRDELLAKRADRGDA
jgi:hypothetical protein